VGTNRSQTIDSLDLPPAVQNEVNFFGPIPLLIEPSKGYFVIRHSNCLLESFLNRAWHSSKILLIL